MKNLTGIGIYSAKEASLLINVKQSDITRWMFGGGTANPLWENQFSNFDELKCIGFHDLLEIRVVDHLKSKGISLQAIRTAIAYAKEVYLDEHPLLTRRIRTDGTSIFAESAKRANDTEFLDLLKHQYAMKPIIEDALYQGIDFDDIGKALRWHPDKKQFKTVVLDPELAFGKPIIIGTGIKTSTLYDSYRAEDKDVAFVAKLFAVKETDVKAAVAYEQNLNLKVAA